MNKINSIILIIVLIVLGLLFYMNYQVKSVEDIFEQRSFTPKTSMTNTVHQTATDKSEKKHISEKPVELFDVDDGLEIPPDEVDAIIGD